MNSTGVALILIGALIAIFFSAIVGLVVALLGVVVWAA
jgi:low affinity Fe/Cu permease